MEKIDKILGCIGELKKADKTKEIDLDNVKITIKVITVEDEIDSHLFAKEYSEKYPEKERGYVYIQKLKQEVSLRSIIKINDIDFEYNSSEEKDRVITALRSIFKTQISEVIVQLIYDNHTNLMKSYNIDYNIDFEELLKDEENKEEKTDKEEKATEEIKVEDNPKTKEEIEKNNKILEKEFDSAVEDGKIVVKSKKDITEIKKEIEASE